MKQAQENNRVGNPSNRRGASVYLFSLLLVYVFPYLYCLLFFFVIFNFFCKLVQNPISDLFCFFPFHSPFLLILQFSDSETFARAISILFFLFYCAREGPFSGEGGSYGLEEICCEPASRSCWCQFLPLRKGLLWTTPPRMTPAFCLAVDSTVIT